MKFLKLFSLFLAATFIFLACRKQDCDCDNQRTDALSNTTYMGAYGRTDGWINRYDTTIVLQFKKNGLLNMYLGADTAKRGVEGKGTYIFDGTTFQATIILNKTGIPYIFKAIQNKEDSKISGTVNYSELDRNGIFYITKWSLN